MRAIQTRYAGCHFRSRLEARWAVFFDAMKWDWEYEPQGFELSSGRYLPDFMVNGLWFEVKGPDSTARERRLMSELVKAGPAQGTPDHGVIASSMPKVFQPAIVRVFTWDDLDSDGSLNTFGRGEPHQSAFEAARSARFEHGQSGPT
jgi:hypothetical protein